MPFNAQVVRVLIASPGDTASPRQVLKDTIEEWNSLHAEAAHVIALPVMWERDATPAMGERPQGILNRQLVDACDVLIGVFWTRLGTPTSEAESGTVEEIERFIRAKKPVILYFSSELVVPQSIDQEQYARLNSFREQMKERGLFDTFETADELRWKSTAALTRTIREHFSDSPEELGSAPASSPREAGPRASLVARITREREVRGFSKSGQPQYSTRERLVIENRGAGPAEDLELSFEVTGDGRLPTVAAPDGPIGRLPPEGAIDFPLMRTFGTAGRWDIVFRWVEGDAKYEERQTLS
jgi:nucleoside 2-deoxyribosyltransferase